MRLRLRGTAAAAIALVTAFGTVAAGTAPAAAATPTDLLISEYIEGSSNN